MERKNMAGAMKLGIWDPFGKWGFNLGWGERLI